MSNLSKKYLLKCSKLTLGLHWAYSGLSIATISKLFFFSDHENFILVSSDFDISFLFQMQVLGIRILDYFQLKIPAGFVDSFNPKRPGLFGLPDTRGGEGAESA